jgi:hypothetical protein
MRHPYTAEIRPETGTAIGNALARIASHNWAPDLETDIRREHMTLLCRERNWTLRHIHHVVFPMALRDRDLAETVASCNEQLASIEALRAASHRYYDRNRHIALAACARMLVLFAEEAGLGAGDPDGRLAYGRAA